MYHEDFCRNEKVVAQGILPGDEAGLFELDSNPEVHRYIDNKPIKHIEEARAYIKFIKQQYEDYGMGRWAIVEKSSNQFIGWARLKYIVEPINHHKDYYDIGYRLIQRYWGLGYATEAAIATRDYAFTEMKLEAIYAFVHQDNLASKHILKKIGLQFIESFAYEDILCDWMELKASDWKGVVLGILESRLLIFM